MPRIYASKVQQWKKDKARDMRNDPTKSEAHLWAALKGRQVQGIKFRRQVVILGWIADFYCSQARLVVELDGSHHDYSKNEHRDAAMRSLGITTLRIQSRDVFTSLPTVLKKIAHAAGCWGHRRDTRRLPCEDTLGTPPLIPLPKGVGSTVPRPHPGTPQDAPAAQGVPSQNRSRT